MTKVLKLPSDLFNSGYWYVSFDVETFFSKVPIKRTNELILKRIYVDKAILANLKKHSIKKLLGTCTKTAFTLNGVISEEKKRC